MAGLLCCSIKALHRHFLGPLHASTSRCAALDLRAGQATHLHGRIEARQLEDLGCLEGAIPHGSAKDLGLTGPCRKHNTRCQWEDKFLNVGTSNPARVWEPA